MLNVGVDHHKYRSIHAYMHEEIGMDFQCIGIGVKRRSNYKIRLYVLHYFCFGLYVKEMYILLRVYVIAKRKRSLNVQLT